MFRSIRHSLFAALAGFTLLICLCYTGLALVISYVTEDMLIDRLLQREAAALTAHFRLHGDLKAPSDATMRVYRSVDALPPVVREQVAAGRERAEISTATGQHYHLRTLDLTAVSGAQKVYLLADVRPLLVVSSLFHEVGALLVSVALGLIALALLLAYLLSRRLVAPLLALAHEVRALTPGRPVALSARHRRDEIGYLAQKLDTTIAELHAALAREHVFTRDVSHELRTPLTIMNNIVGPVDCAALDAGAVVQLRASLDEMGQTIDMLFALARAEQFDDQLFDLRGCIEESLLRLLDNDNQRGAWDDERLLLQLPERLEVAGNRHLTLLLLDNCVGNALFHGGPGARLQLSWVDGVLSVANSVDAGGTGAMQGFRHGQHLLRRIATAMDWNIGFHAEKAEYRVEIRPRSKG